MITEPAAKSANIDRSGKHPGEAAKAIDQPQGQNKSSEPETTEITIRVDNALLIRRLIPKFTYWPV